MNKFLSALFLILSCIFSHAQETRQLDLLIRAERTLSTGDTTQAIDQFQEVLSRFPQNYGALIRLAELYYTQSAYNRSTQYIHLAMDMINHIADDRIAGFNQSQDTLAHDDRFIKQYKTDLAGLYHLLGLNRNRQKRFKDAIEAYEASLEIRPESNVYIDLALTHASNSDYGSAVQNLHRAIQLDSSSYKPFYNLANLHYQAQAYDSALFYYEKTQQLNYRIPWIHLYMGQIYSQKEDNVKAITSLSKFIYLDSSKVEPFFRRALLFTETSRLDEALSDWNSVLALDSLNSDAYRNRGLTHFYLGRYKDAIQDFNQALLLTPKEPYTLINRGYSLYLTGEFDAALHDLDQGVTLLPNYQLGFYFRALVYQKIKKRKLACKDLKKAMQLGFDEKEVDKKLLRQCF